MEGEGPFLGLCLGSENGTNFANKLGSEFGKSAAKRELANPLPTYLLQDSSKRAAEKIKEKTVSVTLTHMNYLEDCGATVKGLTAEARFGWIVAPLN